MTNGWIPLLSSILALVLLPRFRNGSWTAISAIALVSFGALSRVVSSQALENFSRTWGWWLALVGALLLLGATALAAIARITNRRQQPLRRPRGLKEIGGLVGLVLVLFGLYLAEELLAIEEQVSWPPSPDAIAAGDAEEATEAFAAEPSDPMDIALEYAWTTADTIEVWPEGVEFFPLIFEDLEVKHGFVDSRTHRVQWSTFDNVAESKTPIPGATTFNIPSPGEAGYLAADISAEDPTKTVTVYLRQSKIIGIDRRN